MRRGCGGGSVWSTPWRNVLPARPLNPETLQPPWRAVSCQECCVEGLFAGGHTCVCAQSMCVRGTGQKQERSDHTCSPAWAAHTGAPPSLGTSSPPPAGSTSLSGLKKAGVWPRGSGMQRSHLGILVKIQILILEVSDLAGDSASQMMPVILTLSPNSE